MQYYTRYESFAIIFRIVGYYSVKPVCSGEVMKDEPLISWHSNEQVVVLLTVMVENLQRPQKTYSHGKKTYSDGGKIDSHAWKSNSGGLK
jgi:hypothetical protein